MSNLTNSSLPAFCHKIDLLNPRLGAEVLYANDEFFAEKENLIKQDKAVLVRRLTKGLLVVFLTLCANSEYNISHPITRCGESRFSRFF